MYAEVPKGYSLQPAGALKAFYCALCPIFGDFEVDFLRKMFDRLGKPSPQSRQGTAFLREDLAYPRSGNTPQRSQEGSSRDVGRIERNAITNPKVLPKPNTTTSSPTDRAA